MKPDLALKYIKVNKTPDGSLNEEQKATLSKPDSRLKEYLTHSAKWEEPMLLHHLSSLDSNDEKAANRRKKLTL